jgi:hypothetical protein
MYHECCWYLTTALQDSSQQLHTDKAFEAAVSFSQSLSQWAYIVLGGSVACLLKDLKSRPSSRFVRHSFWAFIPGWFFLGRSIYQGMKVQGANIAYLMSPSPARDAVILSFNKYTASQLFSMKWGLGIFALWLVVFLIWWITQKDGSPRFRSFDA